MFSEVLASENCNLELIVFGNILNLSVLSDLWNTLYLVSENFSLFLYNNNTETHNVYS